LRKILGEPQPDGNIDAHPGDIGGVPDEILFPLPANEQQLDIIRRLGDGAGVLVQGPPGTGKSQTIVNLVCHFLAYGKRVLVTSQTPRALRVLEHKFPREVLPSVVSVLDEQEDSRLNLERSVHGILHAVNDPRRAANRLDNEIQRLTKRRRELRSGIADLRRRQQDLREAATLQHVVPRSQYHGTTQQIALMVERNRPQFAWLEDEATGRQVPLTDSEALELTRLWDEFEGRATEVAAVNVPGLNALPSADEFQRAVESWLAARNESERLAGEGSAPAIQWLAGQRAEALAELESLCREWLAIEQEFAGRPDWRCQAVADVIEGRVATWSSLEEVTQSTIRRIQTYNEEARNSEIDSPATVTENQLLRDTSELQKHLESGGRFGWGPFRPAIVRRTRHIWQKTLVNGLACRDKRTLWQLSVALYVRIALTRIERQWPRDAFGSQGTVRARLAVVAEAHSDVRKILTLDKLWQKLRDRLHASPLAHPSQASREWIQELATNVRGAQSVLRVRDSSNNVDQFVCRVVASCRLTNPDASVHVIVSAARGRDFDAYRAAINDCGAAAQRIRKAARGLALWERLQNHAPCLAEYLRAESDREVLTDRFSRLEHAWGWKTAAEWLARFDDEHCPERIVRALEESQRELEEATAELVAARAWHACVTRLREVPERQGAMTAWQQTIQRIGRGTGRNAESDRRKARNYLQQCQHGIPAHVMPLYRVAEQFQFDEPEIFDVVIVDEASQTGPEGLLLTYLAKQCIVVGDDKQISPEAGFVNTAAVNALIEKHVHDVPFADTLMPGTSLFDQASIHFHNRITLREHFRCMPEIIRFSNDLCYQNTPLDPLRQYPPDRLIPLADRFVVDGYREGTDQRVINRPEAAAVAQAVSDCLIDPKYRGRSFGVICLQGHAQAQLIEQMLLERVGPEPFKDTATRLLCGNPYSFQGDERDVIFLSMVVATEGEVRHAALTGRRFTQRFNVAASRARDQMWLFHSIREIDLNPQCMRCRLIQFMSNNPELLSPKVDVPKLRRVSTSADRNLERPPEPFDSWFEVDVFLALVDSGFRVLPQYPVAGKWIDLVVEDSQGRVAVECDGDQWHGPEAYEEDCQREAVLKRAGWRFIRLRASTFYANRSHATDWLVDQLATAGIERWQPADDAAEFHAVDRAEVRGADSLAWLGSQTADTAESGLAELVVNDGDDVELERETDQSAEVDDRAGVEDGAAQNLQTQTRRLRSEPREMFPGNTTHEVAGNLGSAEEVQPGISSPASDDLETIHQARLIDVLSCLFQVREPLTAGQIRWRTNIDHEGWREVEAALLESGLVQQDGTGPRARLALTAEVAEALVGEPSLTSDVSGNGEFDEVDSSTWFSIAHWAKVNGNLQPWQRGLAYSLGARRRDGISPSVKQVAQGKRILAECRRLGFFDEPGSSGQPTSD